MSLRVARSHVNYLNNTYTYHELFSHSDHECNQIERIGLVLIDARSQHQSGVNFEELDFRSTISGKTNIITRTRRIRPIYVPIIC